ncbi:MAG: DUF354 domain-containing protein [Arcobacteraceae bacterium]
MNKNILTIITEGGKTFGLGHITRCLSISSAFKKFNYDVNFIINGDDSVIPMLNDRYIIFNWLKDESMLIDNIKQSTLVLIDSIKISDCQILKIQKLHKKLIFIDDDKRRNILNTGFVLYWTVLSEEKNYFNPKKENVKYLIGSKYTPLRGEFNKAKKNDINENIKNILITFGGSDIRNLTPLILNNLVKRFPLIEKNIIIGPGFDNKKEIEKYKDNYTNFIFNANTQQMITLMQENDIAIACGGQTLYELAKIGTPTIAILVVDNAKDDTLGWNEVGTLDYIGTWEDIDLIDNLITSISTLKNRKLRLKMQQNSLPYISDNGTSLLVTKIIENLK